MFARWFGSSKSARILVIVWVAIFSLLDHVYAQHPWERVQRLLEAEGCSTSALTLLFSSVDQPAYRNVVLSMRIREATLRYDVFLEPAALAKAGRFWRIYDDVLRRIGAAYQVDPAIIVAVLLVESALGEQTGRHPVATTLVTFALMLDPWERERVWRMLPEQDRARWSRDQFHTKLEQRALWALNELRALATLIDRGAPEAATWQGSYMAAVGWPQFLPSSLLRYGADGDGDGKVNVNKPEDAFASVAHYLKSYGWKDDGSPETQERVILQYNNSRPYARTVMEVARRLRQERSTPGTNTTEPTPSHGHSPR